MTPEKFWTRTEIMPSGCIEWRGAHKKGGYGHLVHDGHHTGAHRYAWLITHGKPPADLDVCHTCDNPPCVNPEHLFLGTRKDNTRDCIRKGRQAPIPISYGEANASAKLTANDIVAIRELKGGMSGPKVAARFGVTSGCIYHIWSGITWRHVNVRGYELQPLPSEAA